PLPDQKVPSTEDEREAAWEVLCLCRAELELAGLHGEVVGDSGNGWHLAYPVELANDAAARDLHQALLRGLNDRCGTACVRVDVSTYNASRIWKLYGTLARKGAPSEARPHRRSRLLEVAGPGWTAEVARANAEALRHAV